MNLRTLLSTLLFSAGIASAQTTAPPPAPLPLVDPASALQGRALLEALRGGGYVLFFRHAKQEKVTEPPCTVSNLSEEGVAQAKQVSSALHDLRIPVGHVRASVVCRAIDTAKLLDVGPVDTTPALNPTTRFNKDEEHAARMKLLTEPPAPGTDTILVSHSQNSARAEEVMVLDYVEAVVLKPDGKGGARVVARIPRDEWAALAK
jgi:phosphohistidine phosphatase SixA